jgi:head-tail adaptor
MQIGTLRHRVTLDNPGPPQSDADGGVTYAWPPAGGVCLGRRLPANVEPAPHRVTPEGMERPIAQTIEGVRAFSVSVRYLAGVTLQTRVTVHETPADRTLWVSGITDLDSRQRTLILTCAERT